FYITYQSLIWHDLSSILLRHRPFASVRLWKRMNSLERKAMIAQFQLMVEKA
ncbi:hypothetical protein BGZ76_003076, partial [Entomortierella beljakovae]